MDHTKLLPSPLSILNDMNFSSDSDILCAQVGPFQPSLQMQVKASPPPTHVPPFSQGPESHVLFLAKNTRFYFLTKVLLV